MYLVIFSISFFLSVILGLIGVSGGVLLLPLLLYYNFTPNQIAGIFLIAGIIPSSLPAAWVYLKHGHVKWKPIIIISIASLIGTYIGSMLATHKMIPEIYVYRLFAAIMALGTGYTIYEYCLV
jgi:uncharacterized membrane protein YfcA